MSPDIFLYIALGYVAIINMLTFVFFGVDKFSAHKKWWRISEKTLWGLALFGGSVGALLGMKYFRHKTKKASFQLVLTLILVFQALAIILFFYGVWNSWLNPDPGPFLSNK